MGSLGSEHRQEYFKEKYETSKMIQENSSGYHYGSHYSNPGIVVYYLLRLDPFHKANFILQGNKYDQADRLFSNIKDTFQSATEDNADVRELIPEFYYLPEMFMNINHYQFGRKTSDDQLVDGVQLPLYAHNNPYQFTIMMRQALESAVVSNRLHHWIDLVWGYKQKGKEAINSQNVFYFLTYEDDPIVKNHLKSQTIDPQLKTAYETQLANFGQTPSQLFKTHHQQRKPKEQVLKGILLTESNSQLRVFKNQKSKESSLSKTRINTLNRNYGADVFRVSDNASIYIKMLNNNKILVIRRDGVIQMYQFYDYQS